MKIDVDREMRDRGTKSGRGQNGDSEKDGAKKKRRMNNKKGEKRQRGRKKDKQMVET